MMTKAADYSKTRAPDGFYPLGALLLKTEILSRIIAVIWQLPVKARPDRARDERKRRRPAGMGLARVNNHRSYIASAAHGAEEVHRVGRASIPAGGLVGRAHEQERRATAGRASFFLFPPLLGGSWAQSSGPSGASAHYS